MNKIYVDLSNGNVVFYETYQGVSVPKCAKRISQATKDKFVNGAGKYSFAPNGELVTTRKGAR